MYVKIHDSIFGSSIMEEDLEIRYIWLCMLTVADFEGFIDETISALARRFNVSEDLMQNAIKCFSEPDPSSRTIDNDGRRIEPIRETFGWHIINYEKYRNMRNAEDRKEYMRRYMKAYLPKYRQNKTKGGTDKQEGLSKFSDKHDKPKQKQKQKQKQKEIYRSFFDTFWDKYPRKIGKEKCKKKFLSLITGKNNQVILDGLNKYIQYWTDNNTEIEFIPHPLSWLNQRRWEDEILNIQDNDDDFYEKQTKAFIERHKNDKEDT